MTLEFPFTPTQLRRAGYKLENQMLEYFNSIETDSDYTIKNLLAIATDPNWSMALQSVLNEFANGYNNSTRYVPQRMISVFGALDFDDETVSLLMAPLNAIHSISGYYLEINDLAKAVQDWRLNHAPEDVKDDLTAQLRNIRIAYRLAEVVNNLNNEMRSSEKYSTDHMLAYIRDLMSFAVNRSLIPGDGTRFQSRFAYAVKNLDQFSLEFGLELYNRLHSEEFTITDNDLEMLTVFTVPCVLKNEYPNFVTNESDDLCFYGVPINWIDVETRERLSSKIIDAAYPGSEMSELLISQPLYMAYTLAQVSEGIYNFAIDIDDNPIDFTHAEGKVIVSYKGIPHDLELDLDKDSLNDAMTELDIPF